jgi:predicted MFS family arabinose efflux permease
MFSDWLQGPYVYELYVSYGFNQAQIAELFVCGFGSSMVVGTFIGGLADKFGRKAMCIMYSVCYIIGCCTKLVPEYWTLMVGRFLSGVSTSLLFSVFEAWMVAEHHKQVCPARQHSLILISAKWFS